MHNTLAVEVRKTVDDCSSHPKHLLRGQRLILRHASSSSWYCLLEHTSIAPLSQKERRPIARKLLVDLASVHPADKTDDVFVPAVGKLLDLFHKLTACKPWPSFEEMV